MKKKLDGICPEHNWTDEHGTVRGSGAMQDENGRWCIRCHVNGKLTPLDKKAERYLEDTKKQMQLF